MWKKAFCLCLLFLSLEALAQTSVDSLYLVENLQQVIITGTRTPKTLLNTPVLTRVISHEEIAKADATTLQDILQEVVPGVEFSYSMNQQRHMNFSGFGGQSMLILVDGERLAGETMDDVDFDRLTLSCVDHIEIVKGAASALYGSNANGGVINIITKATSNLNQRSLSDRRSGESKSQTLNLNVNGRIGKHGDQRYGLTWRQGGKRLGSTFDFSRTSRDNYNVSSVDNPVTRVINTIYGDKTYNFKEQLTYNPFDNMTLSGRAGYFFRETMRSADTPERYRDYSTGLRAMWQVGKDDDIEASYSFDKYDKSDFQRVSKLDIRDYSNVQTAFRMLYTHTFSADNILTVGADYMHDYLFNTHLEGRTRHQDSFDAFAQDDWTINPIWEVVTALRYDYFSDGSTSRFTPKVSIRHTPVRGLNVRFGYGMGFRAPSLKEKYYDFDAAGIWTILGNPDLKPEVSHNFNLSLEYRRSNYEFLLSGYHNHVENKIASGTPYFASPSDSRPTLPYVNLDTYSVNGMEASVRARWKNGISARVSYSYTDEQLPKDQEGRTANNQYIPARKHAVNAHADWEHRFTTWYNLNIAIDGRVLSGVDNIEYADYYDISRGTIAVSYPAYTMWKLVVGNWIGKAYKFTLAVDNLFNYKPKYHYLNAPLTDGANFIVSLSIDVDKLF